MENERDPFVRAVTLIRASTEAVLEMACFPGADMAHIMRAASLLGRAMACIGWVRVNRLDWDEAAAFKERVESLERAADEAEMKAIEHEVKGN